jgi:hypothetical protein
MFKITRLMLVILLFGGSISFGQDISYDKYILTESDLPGYKLKCLSC